MESWPSTILTLHLPSGKYSEMNPLVNKTGWFGTQTQFFDIMESLSSVYVVKGMILNESEYVASYNMTIYPGYVESLPVLSKRLIPLMLNCSTDVGCQKKKKK